MRYVIETTVRRNGEEDVKKEKIVSEDDANAAFYSATSATPEEGTWRKVVLWIEYDSTDEAPANDGCCYRLVDNNGKKTLRRCSAAQG